MTVIFEADSSVSHEGFSASYRMFDSREGKCKRNFNPFESKTFKSAQVNFPKITLKFSSILTVCGGNYFTSTGVIHSPGWPSNYGHGMECQWVIHAPINQQIELNFTRFNLENHRDCNYDFLEV